jgi:hypothetical protein
LAGVVADAEVVVIAGERRLVDGTEAIHLPAAPL